MTVAQYRELYRLSKLKTDDVVKTALSVCFYYGLTHDTVNAMHPKVFIKLSDRMVKKLNINKPFIPSFKFKRDAKSITFGQFVEIQQWLRLKKNDDFEAILIREIHMVAASILRRRKNHRKQSIEILNQDINGVYYYVIEFLKSYDQLINEFPFLFKSKEEDTISPKNDHYFQKSFGWIYAATTIANHNGIKLEEAYKLPVVRALNDLVYLKAKSDFDNFILKQ